MTHASTAERRDKIVHLAISNGPTNVDELAAYFNVTSSTIRRDLARLTNEGRITRTYGGAIALVGHAEPSLTERQSEAHEQKVLIAEWARKTVSPGDALLLDLGSTVATLAPRLRDIDDLSISTVNLSVITALSGLASGKLFCLGGQFRPLSHGFVGPLAEAAVERLTFDAAFLGTDGVNADGQISEADLQQLRFKELVCRRTTNVYVLAHGEKIGQSPVHGWSRLPLPWTLVTDDSAPADVLSSIEATGVTVVVVPSATAISGSMK